MWGMSASFLQTEGLYWLLFKHRICPSCLKEKYFSKIDCGKFSVWERSLEDETRVLLLVNKPKAYYSVLKSVGFFLPKQAVYCGQNENFTHFWFFYYPTLWGT